MKTWLRCLLFVVVAPVAFAMELGNLTVHVEGRSDLTHAKVKRVVADGILFVCDQGLVKAHFDELDPVWEKTFRAQAASAAAATKSSGQKAAAIQIAQRDAGKPDEWFEGRVKEKSKGMLLLQCIEPSDQYELPAAVHGIPAAAAADDLIVVRDDDLYAIARVGDILTIIGHRLDNYELDNGGHAPCYSVARNVAEHTKATPY